MASNFPGGFPEHLLHSSMWEYLMLPHSTVRGAGDYGLASGGGLPVQDMFRLENYVYPIVVITVDSF